MRFDQGSGSGSGSGSGLGLRRVLAEQVGVIGKQVSLGVEALEFGEFGELGRGRRGSGVSCGGRVKLTGVQIRILKVICAIRSGGRGLV